ncbi:unnamed protein product, partial [Vitis vinifera]
MRRILEANLVAALHFTTDLKGLLNRGFSGHLSLLLQLLRNCSSRVEDIGTAKGRRSSGTYEDGLELMDAGSCT